MAGRSTESLAVMPFIARLLVHLVPIAVALGTFWVLAPQVRFGEITVLRGLFFIALALVVGYVAVVAVIGAVTGAPLSHWPSMLKQLFRGRRES